jgi:DNA-binding NtrC family response regulator
MKFTPRLRLHGKKASETQIMQEISEMIHGTGSRPCPIPMTEVAKMLGVCRKTVYNYMKRMKLEKSNTGRFILPKIPSEKRASRRHSLL